MWSPCLPSWWTTSSSRPAPTSPSAVPGSRGTRSSCSSSGDARDSAETRPRSPRELRPPGSTLFSSTLKTKVSGLRPQVPVCLKTSDLFIQVLFTVPKSDNGRHFSVSGTTIFKSKGRINLDEEMFGLGFDPVRATDGGRYTCLINNRPKPDAVIKMSVLGESFILRGVLDPRMGSNGWGGGREENSTRK